MILFLLLFHLPFFPLQKSLCYQKRNTCFEYTDVHANSVAQRFKTKFCKDAFDSESRLIRKNTNHSSEVLFNNRFRGPKALDLFIFIPRCDRCPEKVPRVLLALVRWNYLLIYTTFHSHHLHSLFIPVPYIKGIIVLFKFLLLLHRASLPPYAYNSQISLMAKYAD